MYPLCPPIDCRYQPLLKIVHRLAQRLDAVRPHSDQPSFSGPSSALVFLSFLDFLGVGFLGIVFTFAGGRARLVLGDFLNMAEEAPRLARIKVVIGSFKRIVIGAAQRQDGRAAHCSELFNHRGFILRWDGVPHDHKIKGTFFTSVKGSGEAYRRFDLKTLAGEQQFSGMQ